MNEDTKQDYSSHRQETEGSENLLRAEASRLADINLNQADSSKTNGAYTVKLETFEGPLDLLLHLIKREEINIWDIPIAKITDQYLSYIDAMQDLNINVAGEFLLMAATLIYIKSKMLLPPDPTKPEEEQAGEEDPRHELVYQLLEHQKFKNAAQMLYTKEALELAAWNHPPQEFLENREAVFSATVFDLVSAYRSIMKKFEERKFLEIQTEEVTIEKKIAEIRSLLLVQAMITFSSLFERDFSKLNSIVIFLAVLELVRLNEIKLRQKQLFDEIFILKAGSQYLAAHSGSSL